MSLLFNMLSRLVITFFPRSKHLLISWLQSPSAVILEPQKIKYDSISTVSPSIWHEVMGSDAMILGLWMLIMVTIMQISICISGVHCSIIHHRQNMQTICLLVRWMDRKIWNIYIYTYIIKIVISNPYKTEGNPDICSNMDELWGHYANWNKSEKTYTISHLYMERKKLDS